MSTAKLIEDGIERIQWLHEQIHDLPVPVAVHYPCALYYVCMQHASGALILLLNQRCAPAFALARPIYETFIRAIWLSLKATEAQKQDAQRDKFPKLSKLVDDLNADPIARPLTQPYQQISLLHSFTHGGIEQISNHLSADTLESNFDDETIRALIDWSCRLAIASSYQFAQLIDQRAVIDTISARIDDEYGLSLAENGSANDLTI